MEKTFIIECENSGGRYGRSGGSTYNYSEGTLSELIKIYEYTLEVGESWEYVKGNKKIDCQPKTIASLVKNINNAENNACQDGYSGKTYKVVTEKRMA